MPSVPESARAIAEALAPEQGAKAVRWRWGTVLSVQSDGTMTVHVGGVDVSGIRAAAHVVGASSGDRVRVSYYGTEAIVDAIRAISDQGGGGGGGTDDYNELVHKPSIESVTLIGNKTFDDLGLSSITNSELEEMLV